MDTKRKVIANAVEGTGNAIAYLFKQRKHSVSEEKQWPDPTVPPIGQVPDLTPIKLKSQPEPQPEAQSIPPEEAPAPEYGVTTDDTVQYQKREISKELLLLEKHLQQGCKINGVPCDCCEKHPIAIEGLAQETLGMTGDHLYSEVADWSKRITPITTHQASASGEHNEDYPELAMEARNLRKRIMGTASVTALLDNDEKRNLVDRVGEALNNRESHAEE